MPYYHVSPNEITEIRDITAPDRTSIKTGGKPSGFWYAEGYEWIRILNRNERTGIKDVFNMELGGKETIGVDTSTNEAKVLQKLYSTPTDHYYLYQVTIPDNGRIYTVTMANLEELYAQFNAYRTQGKPNELSKLEIELLSASLYSDFQEGSFEAILEYMNKIEKNKKYLRQIEEDSVEYYGLLAWFKRSLQQHKKKKAAIFEVLKPDWFVLPRLWAEFWFSSPFYDTYDGLYFDASVITMKDPRIPFLHLLEIPSGCIWRSSRTPPSLELVTRISFDPEEANEQFSVYVRNKKNSTIKQKRKGLRGGATRKRTRRVTSSSKK
jgi:hypothetical protein